MKKFMEAHVQVFRVGHVLLQEAGQLQQAIVQIQVHQIVENFITLYMILKQPMQLCYLPSGDRYINLLIIN